MEHHDFPFINSSSLPMISKIAPEYYNELPQLKSYLLVLKDFIFDPKIGKHSVVRYPQDVDVLSQPRMRTRTKTGTSSTFCGGTTYSINRGPAIILI